LTLSILTRLSCGGPDVIASAAKQSLLSFCILKSEI
jgi:hypothetical protein